MDYTQLKITCDFDGVNAGKTDQEIKDWGDVVEIEVPRDSMTGDEVFDTADTTEWNALMDASLVVPNPADTAEDQQAARDQSEIAARKASGFMNMCGRNSVNPYSQANIDIVIRTFGAPSATVTALNAARKETVNHWKADGLADPTVSEIAHARTL